MSKKYFFLCSFLALSFLHLSANPVNREQARKIAVGFAKTVNLQLDAASAKGYDNPLSAQQFQGLHVFTGADGKGFVIVSADDCTIPILGYSTSNPFPSDTLPESVQAWLASYDSQILYYQQQSVQPVGSITKEWQTLRNYADTDAPKDLSSGSTTVGPLIQTQWDQAPYYNQYCPIHTYRQNNSNRSARTVTGCVATATSQIMKYWNWPLHGRGSNTYTYTYNVVTRTNNSYSSTGTTNSVTLSSSFVDTVFRWDDMPVSLASSSGQNAITAVASLMYNVGIALNMAYGLDFTGGSGAYNSYGNTLGHHTVPEILRDYFYYSPAVTAIEQEAYTDDEWKAILRRELDAGRPMVYGGTSTGGGGHSFVCDGYKSDGTFHFNWGWGGYCDGDYVIGALNPEPGGIGSAAISNYNLYGDAVIGIQPASTIQPETGTTTVIAVPNNDLYGSVTGSGTYRNWVETVSMHAVPNEGYSFLQWSDGCRYNPRNLVAAGGVESFTAIFGPAQGNLSYFGSFPNSFSYYYPYSEIPEWGICLPAARLVNAVSLDAVKFMGYQSTYTVKVYSGGTTAPQTLLYTSNPVTISGVQSYTLQLPTPITLTPGQSLWITLYSTNGNRCFASEAINTTNAHWDYWVNYDVWDDYTYGENHYKPYLIDGVFTSLPSDPVSSLTVSSTSSTGATLSWSAPATATPSSYTISYGPCFSPDQGSTLSVTSTSCSLTGLLSNTEYHAWVRADYNNGSRHSVWVETSFVTTSATNPVYIVAQASDESMGSVLGGGVYERGASVTLQAIPMVGYIFSSWEDNNSTSPQRQVTASSDAVYTALFEPQCYPVIAEADNPALGSVTVEGDPCSSGFPYLSTVVLTATPASGAVFTQWVDGNTTNPRFCTVDGNSYYYQALFESSAKDNVNVSSSARQVSIRTVEPQVVEIFDMLGRSIYSCREGLSFTTVTLPAAGIYLVRVGTSYSEKIIIR